MRVLMRDERCDRFFFFLTGFATTASQQGASLVSIMQQGRWKHTGTALGYMEESKRFEGNAAGLLLKKAHKA